jgi:bifunctional NMN adenylyltransferase/nudix hydrolase
MYDWLQNFVTTQTFADLKEQYELELTYLPTAHEHMVKGDWATNFYTADAVVIQTGHVLLGYRESGVGKGLWRLPGGHVDANETSFEAVIREVYEETNLKIPEKVLVGSYKGEKLFDHPKRSLRGRVTSKNCRTATVSHCFKLADGEALPRVKHGDDLDDVWWFTFNEVKQMRSQIIEDHLSIIDYWLARIEQ